VAKYKTGRPGVVTMEKELLQSKAWRSLSKSAMLVYIEFRIRCQVEGVKRQQRRELSPLPGAIIHNNGRLVLTYKQAEEELGITPTTFRDAIDALINRGFLKITDSGGADRTPTRYEIARDWPLYGSDTFEPERRRKREGQIGFRRARPKT
jgi:hypothetical protein